MAVVCSLLFQLFAESVSSYYVSAESSEVQFSVYRSSGPADVIRRFSGARCNTHVDYALHSIQARTADNLQ